MSCLSLTPETLLFSPNLFYFLFFWVFQYYWTLPYSTIELCTVGFCGGLPLLLSCWRSVLRSRGSRLLMAALGLFFLAACRSVVRLGASNILIAASDRAGSRLAGKAASTLAAPLKSGQYRSHCLGLEHTPQLERRLCGAWKACFCLCAIFSLPAGCGGAEGRSTAWVAILIVFGHSGAEEMFSTHAHYLVAFRPQRQNLEFIVSRLISACLGSGTLN